MKKKLLLLVTLLIVGAAAIIALLTNKVVSAVSIQDMSPILSKALFSSLRKCYLDRKINPDIGASFSSIHGSIMLDDNDEDFAKLPNGFTDITDNGLKCEELINGYNSYGATGNNRFPGLLSLAGVPEPNSTGQMTTASLKTFFEGMGYISSTPQSSSTNGRCFQFSLTVTKFARGNNINQNSGIIDSGYPKTYYTHPLCAASIINGNIDVDKLELDTASGSADVLDVAEFSNKWFVMYGLDISATYGLQFMRTGDHGFTKGDKWLDFVNGIYSDLSGKIGIGVEHGPDAAGHFWVYSLGVEKELPYGGTGPTATTWSFSNSAIASNTAINYLSHGVYANYPDLQFTGAERTILYQTYLNNVYKIVAHCNETNSDLRQQYEANGYFLARIIKDGTFNDDCYVQPKENISYNNARGYFDDKGVNGLDADWHFSQTKYFEEILDALRQAPNLTPEEIAAISGTVGSAPSAAPPGTSPNTPGGTQEEEKPDPCYDASGSLGWVLCPVITWLGETMQKVYEWAIEPYLKIDAPLLAPTKEGSDQEGGTYAAWRIFQNFANIVFVILLLVVIFSQLTGFGIDNYGIKKLLPRLIIAALLINLSYIICQLAVDISNTLGYSLTNTLTTIADENIEVTMILPDGTKAANIVTIITGVVGILIGGGMIAAMGLSIFIPLGLALLSGVIAVLFLFLLLGIRRAGVVLLVALSPLAFVCYALPNTKKIFEKWAKMLQGLLLVFPIAGLLIGGGYLTSRILLSTNNHTGDGGGNFFVHLIALLLLVVPFFLIPMLLKSSFAAMGNIGAKISGVGRGLNRQVVGKGKPALERSRLGQRLTRGRDYRLKRKAEASKFRASQFESAQAGTYSGRDRLLRARSRINEHRAASRLPIFGTNTAALERKGNYRHKNEQGQYDGVGRIGVNMQLQALGGGNVVQGDSDFDERYEDVMEAVKDQHGNVVRNEDGTVKMQQKIGDDGKVVQRVIRTRRDRVNTKNVVKDHSGGMTSAASMRTFDEGIASMNSNDIEDAGASYNNIRGRYEEISLLGRGGESTKVQAERMYDNMMAIYEAMGRTGDDAKRQVEQQLGFKRNDAATMSEYKLHQMKDEAKRRASEMGKRRTEAGKEATMAAMGQNNANPPASGGAPPGGSPPAGGRTGSGSGSAP